MSHLQFAVLSILSGQGRPGREVREQLRKMGFRRTLAAFYQLMARLEEAGLVEGAYQRVEADGQFLRERRYRITALGQEAWQAAADFYEKAIGAVRRQGGLANA
ncbi:MAG: PadR family transcriptional regulator [Acidobacteriota bacterium]